MNKYLWVLGDCEEGVPATFERVYEITEIETERLVECQAQLIMQRGGLCNTGLIDKWSLEKHEFEDHLMVPITTIREKGLGVGTFLRDRVIERAKEKFSLLPVVKAKLALFDSTEENHERRERFYKSAGFDVVYKAENKRIGSISAASVEQLIVSRPLSSYYTLDAKALINLLSKAQGKAKKLSNRLGVMEEKAVKYEKQAIFGLLTGFAMTAVIGGLMYFG